MTVYSYCKQFGWTINEFYEQPKLELEKFAVVMSEISKLEAENQRKMKQKQASPRRR